ncbi:MAG: hypothetical protein WAU45_23815 [Blastocatellia bacterium]
MLTRIFLICVGMLIAAQTSVYAYADPGSGTLIWQILLAASFGVMFYLRRIIGWLRGLKSGKQNSTSANALAAVIEEESESIKRPVN